MPSIRLETHRVEKPWGRRSLWPGFANPAQGGEPVGEVWFEETREAELLVKYLFTSEKLSIQVHPDDAAAQASGYPRGKDEAWVVLDAAPDSTIGQGLTHSVSHEELRAAALDGSIETLIDWKPVKAGDVIYSPARTVHAIGAGVTVVEVQQNLDLTYRLYDYGRPRELHLDEGIAVSDPVPFAPPPPAREASPGRTILAKGGKFVLERWTWAGDRALTLPQAVPGWFVPVAGAGEIDGAAWKAGECWRIDGEARISAKDGADMLFAYPVPQVAALFG